MGQYGFNYALLFHQGPERLRNRWDAPEGLCHDVVPGISVPQEIVRPYFFSAERRSTETYELVFQVEGAIIIGEFFSRANVTHCQLKVIASAATGGIT